MRRLARLGAALHRVTARHLHRRIVAVFLGLLLLVQAASFLAIRHGIEVNARRDIAGSMHSGEILLRRLLAQNAQQLREAARLLAADYGFRAAIAVGDQATLTDALANQAERIDASVAVFTDPRGKPMASTIAHPEQVLAVLAADARADPALRGESGLQVHEGQPFQMVTVPVRAPQLIGHVSMGFPLSAALPRDLAELSSLRVLFLARPPGGAWTALRVGETPLPAALDARDPSRRAARQHRDRRRLDRAAPGPARPQRRARDRRSALALDRCGGGTVSAASARAARDHARRRARLRLRQLLHGAAHHPADQRAGRQCRASRRGRLRQPGAGRRHRRSRRPGALVRVDARRHPRARRRDPPPRLLGSADRPAESRAVSRVAARTPGRRAAQRRPLLGADARHRPLQARQRRARPRLRRSPARQHRGAPERRHAARARHAGPARRRQVRALPAARRRRGGGRGRRAAARLARAAAHARRAHRRRDRRRRHRQLSGACRFGRPAARPGRAGDVRGQGAPGRRDGLRRRARFVERAIAVAARRAAHRDRRRPAAPVPAAEDLARHRRHQRRRSAGALAASAPRPAHAGAVRAVRRADRLHPRNHRLDGRPERAPLQRACATRASTSRSPSTSRPRT